MPSKGKIPWGLRQEVYERDGWKCRHCSCRMNLDPHHVVFRSQGGENSANNLLTLCRRCHDDIHGGRLRLEVVGMFPFDLEVKFWRQQNPWRAHVC